ncbi:type II toxin-antitoxin system RelE/ParE family toxin [Devosia sp. YIM 151766]|uniref:type II toxin-antitoxin system RelE/ParE family toxin n=1 Tax=Devosia sp. YIM 151766 TaxID=3017325 RepID=UPI00255C8217|nr:type II toxin-antitoxin system RelE/ParE family toxin [Devosia sp. YIM 151766]WIY51678.1 type II toxin-antitoxin system RelE/ParE family toxin [Devosia sp. YIM 151766]
MRDLPVRLREEALADLEEIASYLVEHDADEAVVHGFVQRILQQCRKIGHAPEGYVARPDLGAGIRIAPFERSAVIAFRITEESVEIVNVFYGGRDYAALFES